MSLSHRKHAIFCVDVNEHNGKICRKVTISTGIKAENINT